MKECEKCTHRNECDGMKAIMYFASLRDEILNRPSYRFGNGSYRIHTDCIVYRT